MAQKDVIYTKFSCLGEAAGAIPPCRASSGPCACGGHPLFDPAPPWGSNGKVEALPLLTTSFVSPVNLARLKKSAPSNCPLMASGSYCLYSLVDSSNN